MATYEVPITTIEVFPHPNADRLELARVGLYNIVVGKGTYQTGDKVLYIPEYSVLPDDLIVTLGLEGKLAGSKKNRVKPVSLRGALSQGLVAPLSVLPEGALERIGEDGDFAEVLGVKKWEPEVPASMSGEVEPNYDLIPWIEIESLKKFPDMFAEGDEVIVDEKIHGTATLITFVHPNEEDEKVLISSKGLGAKSFTLREDERNVYWRVFKNFNLARITEVISQFFPEDVTFRRVGLFGETFGSKVQDLHYGFRHGDLGYTAFDIYVDLHTPDGGSEAYWVDGDTVQAILEAAQIPTVPRLFKGPFNMDQIIELANGPENVSGEALHIREGVVVRPVNREHGVGKGRIGKFVSEDYLTRKGTDGQAPTEFN